MPDPFDGFSNISSQGERWAIVVPSDSIKLDPKPKVVRAGGAGDIMAVGSDGVAIAFTVVAGEVLQIRPVLIKATGTTAANIVAIF